MQIYGQRLIAHLVSELLIFIHEGKWKISGCIDNFPAVQMHSRRVLSQQS